MPEAITPPSINSKDIVISQTVACEKIEASRGEEAEADRDKHNIAHVRTLKAL
jgi:hypothetical protein